jgi:tetratricopeptide (TPR) repeat protein
MKLLSIPLKATFGCLTILILFGDLATQAQSASGADIRIRESFYDLLDVILDDSSADQIFTLQGFIENHPGFERAYLKLLERYLVHNKMAEAKAYFQKLAARSVYRRNSYWMLAKLFILQNDTSASIKAYHQAFRAGPPSTALLKDFVEYHHHSKKTEWPPGLRQLRLSAECAKLGSAFFHFFNLNDDQAIRLFCEIPDAASHDALVFDVLGHCYYRLSRYSEADFLWRLGLASSRLRKDLELEAQFLCNLGLLSAKANGQYNQALSYCDSAYALAERLDDLYLKQFNSKKLCRSDQAVSASHRVSVSGWFIQLHSGLASWLCKGAHPFAAIS